MSVDESIYRTTMQALAPRQSLREVANMNQAQERKIPGFEFTGPGWASDQAHGLASERQGGRVRDIPSFAAGTAPRPDDLTLAHLLGLLGSSQYGA